MARIKQRKGVVTLSSRDWFHGDDGMVQVVVMTCFGEHIYATLLETVQQRLWFIQNSM